MKKIILLLLFPIILHAQKALELHPWQLTFQERKTLKLEKEKDICRNYMNYICFTDSFTPEQIYQMYWFTQKYRNYLLVKK